MTTERITYLHQQYLNHRLTPGELEELKAALNHPDFEQSFEDFAEIKWNELDQNIPSMDEGNAAMIYGNIIEQEQNKRPVRLWPRIAVAAAAVGAIVIGVWFFNAPKGDRHAKFISASQQDIAPGKNGATITLANGKVIALSDAKSGVVVGAGLKYSDGSDVRYSSGSRSSGPASPGQSSTGPVGVHSLTPAELQGADGKAQQLTASTAKGQTYQFTLPDGTKVWLNADSKISFPSQFSGKERKILLDGEGYFEVVHNAKQPFKVESKGQVVEDIGTTFNINAYGDEVSVKTTLVEGEARVYLGGRHPEFISGSRNSKGGGPDLYRSSTAQADDVVLKPNQQSILTGSNRITVKKVNPEEAVAWKEGVFIFNSTPLDQIMRQVSRWYNVEIIYDNPELKGELMGGSVSRYDKVSRILKTLENTGAVKFRIVGGKVYVGK